MYRYEDMKPKLFTEEGVKTLRTVERNVRRLISTAGAVRAQEAWSGISGDSWTWIACLDYLVEAGTLRCVTGSDVWAQHRVYVLGNR